LTLYLAAPSAHFEQLYVSFTKSIELPEAVARLLGAPKPSMHTDTCCSMETKKPLPEEFEYRHSVITHKPTGATWTTIPGVAEFRSYRPSKLGVVLENGFLHDPAEVRTVAKELLLNPLPQKFELKEERRWRRGHYS
jgi:hypothetical protein